MRVLRNHWRPIAITACLLGMFWPVAQYAFVWAEIGEGWLYRGYFLDQYVAAFVLGLIAARWAFPMMTVVPMFGAVAAVVVTVGVRGTHAEFSNADYGPAWSTYLEAALPWLWIAGLIALGVALSRQVGGFDFSREP